MDLTIALVGNPNSGKTTMFNQLTGSRQYVGNWPGVTVEKKEGILQHKNTKINLIDLPGIYSLSPYSLEEIITRDFIFQDKPDIVINIVDATNLERNLYLTTQLLETGAPIIIALNMFDALSARGDIIDLAVLGEKLGVSIIPTSASKGTGLQELLDKAIEIIEHPHPSRPAFFLGEDFISSIETIANALAESTSEVSRNELSWTALKIMEKDQDIIVKHAISEEIITFAENQRLVLEKENENDIEAAIATSRYNCIDKIVKIALKKKHGSEHATISEKIDMLLTHRILAIPIFLGIMFLVFKLTFATVGALGSDFLDILINEKLSGALSQVLTNANVSEWLHSLIINGIIAGLGSILIFLPQILVLFFFLSVLEDSGYMARAAFITDRLLRKIGLSGKSFIPMLLGFGCSVPAIMTTRGLENEAERRMTIMLTPFMSCSARLPVYAVFVGAFFVRNQGMVIFSLYLLGIIVAIISGLLLRNTVFRNMNSNFVMELPPYRLPSVKSLWLHMYERSADFIKKAGTIIFAASIVIWFCQNFDLTLQMTNIPEQSIFGFLGSAIAPIFAPLGFGDWKSSVALLTGLVAKEMVVATLSILNNAGGDLSNLSLALKAVYTPLQAYTFLVFTLLYIPCIAAIATIWREMNNYKWTLFALFFQSAAAWLVAFAFYQGGKALGFN